MNTCTLTVLGSGGGEGVILFQMCLYSLHDTTCLKPKARVNKTRAMHPILLHILSVFLFFLSHHFFFFFSSSFFVFFFPSLFFFSTSPTTFTSCVECRRPYSPHSLLGYLLFSAERTQHSVFNIQTSVTFFFHHHLSSFFFPLSFILPS